MSSTTKAWGSTAAPASSETLAKGDDYRMTVHHARTLHGSAPNYSDRSRLILFYEIAKADAWPLLGSGSYFHTLGQQRFWQDLQARTIIGEPCLTPRVELVPVRMPLPPAADSSSIFRTQRSRGAKTAFALKPEK